MLKNHRGFTLIEVLSVITLLSMVLLFASSFHIFGQKQMVSQSLDIENQTNVRYALNLLTKEIRTGKVDLPVDNNILTIKTETNTTVYKLEGKTITKNGIPIVENIFEFVVKGENIEDEDGKTTHPKIELKITSIPNNEGKIETLSTIIHSRVKNEVEDE